MDHHRRPVTAEEIVGQLETFREDLDLKGPGFRNMNVRQIAGMKPVFAKESVFLLVRIIVTTGRLKIGWLARADRVDVDRVGPRRKACQSRVQQRALRPLFQRHRSNAVAFRVLQCRGGFCLAAGARLSGAGHAGGVKRHDEPHRSRNHDGSLAHSEDLLSWKLSSACLFQSKW